MRLKQAKCGRHLTISKMQSLKSLKTHRFGYGLLQSLRMKTNKPFFFERLLSWIPITVLHNAAWLLFSGKNPHLHYKAILLTRNTNGRALKDKDLVNELVTAGLDHVQITLESNLESIHNQMVRNSKAWAETLTGLRNVLKTRLYVMTNTTLLKTNVKDFGAILDFLAAEGVPTVGINALIYSGSGATVNTGIAEKDLPPLLELAHQKTQSNGQRLIWYTPTQYCHFNPVLLGFGVKGCSAAYYNMCIEPDGKVIPCQSYYEAIGDILKDTWETIWEHPLCLSLRSRSKIDPVCKQCDYLRECGGGCPLAREHQSTPEPIIQSEICILEE
jgi:radical SAM protein with 4Fe4S-binding SPASM domain